MSAAKIFLLILGAVTIVYGFMTPRFYPGAFGVGDRARTIPKWVGRLWFSLIGLWLIYMGLVGSTPLIVERVIAVGLGVVIILSGLGARAKNQPASPGVSLGISSEPKLLGGLLFIVVGIGFIVGGLLLVR
jgi:hypothetical protein